MTEPIGTTNIGDLRMTEQIAERHFGQGCNMGGTDGLKPMPEPEKTCGNCGEWTPCKKRGWWGGELVTYGRCDAPTPLSVGYPMRDKMPECQGGGCPCWKERE